MSDVCARLRIHGRVQGVFFRQSAADEANRLGLAGWVRNAPDGSVEGEAEGPRPSVEAFVRWSQHGPPGARVERVDVEWGAARGTERPFAVRV
jgi:acylphosphatase